MAGAALMPALRSYDIARNKVDPSVAHPNVAAKDGGRQMKGKDTRCRIESEAWKLGWDGTPDRLNNYVGTLDRIGIEREVDNARAGWGDTIRARALARVQRLQAANV
jgi:hypothetical protein